MSKPKEPSVHIEQLAAEQSKLVSDVRQLIEDTRSSIAITVNTGMTMLYRRIGKRIQVELLKGERAAYGEAIVPTPPKELLQQKLHAAIEQSRRRSPRCA